MTAKRLIRLLLILITIGLLLLFINFIPSFSLETPKMTSQQTDYIEVYYEEEEAAALDVMALAEVEAARLREDMQLIDAEPIRIYIYDQQAVMQQKKYGYLANFLQLAWYIGDNRGSDVILTSPARPGPEHSYDSVKGSVVHELVHAYLSQINPQLDLWLSEGLALYLSNGEIFQPEWLATYPPPGMAATQSQNPLTFANANGYMYAHTFIAYLVEQGGWESVMSLLRGASYEEVYGRPYAEIYQDWLDSLADSEGFFYKS